MRSCEDKGAASNTVSAWIEGVVGQCGAMHASECWADVSRLPYQGVLMKGSPDVVSQDEVGPTINGLVHVGHATLPSPVAISIAIRLLENSL